MRKIGLYVILAALILGAACAEGQHARRKVIIDQDAFGVGGPNMQPMLMALQSPDVEILGITVESGDGWQDENVAHTLRMLELVHRTEIPVYRGATYPIVNSMARSKAWEHLHGTIPYKGAWQQVWPKGAMERMPFHEADVVPPLSEGNPTIKAAPGTATEFMIRSVHKFPGEVSVVAMGPLTNIALASRLDDSFGSLAKEIVFMGGSFHPIPAMQDEFADQIGNTPAIDFNFRWDPEAASIMLHAGWKRIVVLPTDATMDTKFTLELLKRIRASDSPAAKYVAHYPGLNFPLWDEAAMAVWLDPAIVARHSKLAMDVQLDSSSAGYGATLSWPSGHGPGLGEPEVEVVYRVHVPALNELFVKTITAHSPH